MTSTEKSFLRQTVGGDYWIQFYLSAGKYMLMYDFKYDGGGMSKGGIGTISANGNKAAEARLEKTQPGIFSVDDLADIGTDDGTHVAD